MEQRAGSLRSLVIGNVMGNWFCLQPGHPGPPPEAIRLSKDSQLCGVKESPALKPGSLLTTYLQEITCLIITCECTFPIDWYIIVKVVTRKSQLWVTESCPSFSLIVQCSGCAYGLWR